MSILYDTKRASYTGQRGASHGAGITLVCGCGEYTASFDCARRIAAILGSRELKEAADGLYESIPIYKIQVADIMPALQKLSETFSIALVDIVCEKLSTRFVCVWRIEARKPLTTSQDVNDY